MSNGPQFHQTGYGRAFFELQLPKLIASIETLSVQLKRANDLKEQEMNGESSRENLDAGRG